MIEKELRPNRRSILIKLQHMTILNSEQKDLTEIFRLYRLATDYMKSKQQVYWPQFSEELIVQEIEDHKQWKLLIENEIACIWATTLNDELIWGSKNEPALYIHRIATNPKFRGQNLAKKVFEWANEFGKSKQLQYTRMDTVGLNKGLISHYQKMGFTFLGARPLKNTNGLPDHYKAGEVCYFQKEIV